MNTQFKYYIDESGNTGDLISKKWISTFEKQPFFVLAAIGTTNDDKLRIGTEFEKIIERHKLNNIEELKSASNNPGVYEALLDVSRLAIQCPHIIEIVEKKYMLCMSITRHFYSKINESLTTYQLHQLEREVCEELYEHLTHEDIESFMHGCFAPSLTTIRNIVISIIKNNNLRRVIKREVLGNFNLFKHQEENLLHHYFPLPDRRGKKIYHLLPNICSLTAILSRINKNHYQDIQDISIIHDTQKEYGSIFLENVKNQIEDKNPMQLPHIKGVDYNFTNEFNQIKFEPSSEKMIQIVDVLAGFSNRCFTSILTEKELPKNLLLIFKDLIGISSYPQSPLGINFYVSNRTLRAVQHLLLSTAAASPKKQAL